MKRVGFGPNTALRKPTWEQMSEDDIFLVNDNYQESLI